MTSSLRGALSLHNGSSGETADHLCLPDRSCRCVFHSVSLARSREQLNRLTAGSKSFPAMSFVHADSPRKGHHPHCRRLPRTEEHTSELQSLMRISYAVFCLKKKNKENKQTQKQQ